MKRRIYKQSLIGDLGIGSVRVIMKRRIYKHSLVGDLGICSVRVVLGLL